MLAHLTPKEKKAIGDYLQSELSSYLQQKLEPLGNLGKSGRKNHSRQFKKEFFGCDQRRIPSFEALSGFLGKLQIGQGTKDGLFNALARPFGYELVDGQGALNQAAWEKLCTDAGITYRAEMIAPPDPESKGMEGRDPSPQEIARLTEIIRRKKGHDDIPERHDLR